MKHYLDYAATSAVRPRAVIDAMSAFLTDCGATPGRGGHQWTIEAGRVAFRCRRVMSRLLGLPGDPGRIAFMQNATHALNTALFGLLRDQDTVVVSQYSHNAVLRPVHYLSKGRGVTVRMLSGHPDGSVDLDELERLADGAELVVINAASNVLGTRAPVREMARVAREAGALVLLDAAQSAGHFVGSHAEEGADMIAFTGHKGLLGPQGMGALWIRDGIQLDPLVCGGTGGDSTLRDMPPAMPDHLEAGTHNSPGIAGLCAGVEFLIEEGVEEIHAKEMALKAALRDGLGQIDGVRVLSPPGVDGVGVVTIDSEHVDPATLARRLDSEFGVMTRAGIHCAPEVHRILGTMEHGAVRFSVGWDSSQDDVDAAIHGVDAIVEEHAATVS